MSKSSTFFQNKTNQFQTHRDHSNQSSSSSSSNYRPTTSFKNQPPTGNGTDEDIGFSTFASTSSSLGSFDYSTPYSTSYNTNTEFSARNGGTSEAGYMEESDPNSIQNLLTSGKLNESIYSNWEEELLFNRQSTDWKSQEENFIPIDPIATSNLTSMKGKGKQQSSNSNSITEEEIILSSLTSLDLQSIQYLKTLLSLPESESIQNYLNQNSYSEDIYGGIQNKINQFLIESDRNASSVGTGGEEVEGRIKAVRRLDSIMKHLLINRSTNNSTSPILSTQLNNTLNSMEGIVDSTNYAASTNTQDRGRDRTKSESDWDLDNSNRSSSASSFSRIFNSIDSAQSQSQAVGVGNQDQLSHTIHRLSNFKLSEPHSSSSSSYNIPVSKSTNILQQGIPQHQQFIEGEKEIEEVKMEEDENLLDENLPSFQEFMQTKLNMLKLGKGAKFTLD